MKINRCRICKDEIVNIVSFGNIPPVNYYPKTYSERNKKYPLNLCLCETCGLVQLDEMVSPGKLFSNYHYVSSESLPLKKHLEELASYCKKRFKLRESSVLDIGCNDGTFLKNISNSGIRTLGIDPAKNISKISKKKELNIITDFFSYELAKKIKGKYPLFDVIVSTNAFAHIIDLNDFLRGVKLLLSPSGVFVIEVGYLLDMIAEKSFDSIYHEHVSYFSIQALTFLFKNHDFEIFDARRIDMHGGSIRVFIKNKSNSKLKETNSLRKLVSQETRFKLDRRESYRDFVRFVKDYKNKFKSLLTQLKKNNSRIVGWGAPAKSVVIMHYCEINESLVDYIIDSTDFKQNRYVPGFKIPVYPEDRIMKDVPDYLIFFIWTYKKHLKKKLVELKKKNIKIIIPFPEIKII